MGTVDKACSMLAGLIRGAEHDRQTIAQTWGVGLAAADRYVRALRRVPGVQALRIGRRLVLRWSHNDARRAPAHLRSMLPRTYQKGGKSQ